MLEPVTFTSNDLIKILNFILFFLQLYNTRIPNSTDIQFRD